MVISGSALRDVDFWPCLQLCVALDDQVKVWEKCDQASVLSVAPFGNHYDIQGRPKVDDHLSPHLPDDAYSITTDAAFFRHAADLQPKA